MISSYLVASLAMVIRVIHVCICTHTCIHTCIPLLPSIVVTVTGISNDIQLAGIQLLGCIIGNGDTSDTCIYMYTHMYTYMYIIVPEYCEYRGGY